MIDRLRQAELLVGRELHLLDRRHEFLLRIDFEHVAIERRLRGHGVDRLEGEVGAASPVDIAEEDILGQFGRRGGREGVERLQLLLALYVGGEEIVGQFRLLGRKAGAQRHRRRLQARGGQSRGEFGGGNIGDAKIDGVGGRKNGNTHERSGAHGHQFQHRAR
jgi:hypothetical protein